MDQEVYELTFIRVLRLLRHKHHKPEVYEQAFLETTSRHRNYVHIFTDGSKVDEKLAAAAVTSVAPKSPFSCRLRDHCTIYTAELLFALKQSYQSQEMKFMNFSDLLSALQALGKLQTLYPLLIQIQDLSHKMDADQKEIVFMLDMLVFEEMRLLIELLWTRNLQRTSCSSQT